MRIVINSWPADKKVYLFACPWFYQVFFLCKGVVYFYFIHELILAEFFKFVKALKEFQFMLNLDKRINA